MQGDAQPVVMLLSLSLVAAVAGCASPSDDPLVQQERSLGPNGFLEVNLEMDGNATVEATYEANASIAWDVHSHASGEVSVHDAGEGETGTIRFTAPASGAFSILWENEGSERVTLSITVTGGARVDSVLPPA